VAAAATALLVVAGGEGRRRRGRLSRNRVLLVLVRAREERASERGEGGEEGGEIERPFVPGPVRPSVESSEYC